MVEGRPPLFRGGLLRPPSGRSCAAWRQRARPQLGSPAGEGLLLCDAGCGEGYYTAGLREALPQAQVCGFDISKLAVKAAAGKYKSVEFGGGKLLRHPLGEGQRPPADRRVLSPGGGGVRPGGKARGAFSSTPCRGRGTCTASRSCCTRTPMKTPHRETEYPGFRFVGRTAVRGEIRVPDSQTAVDLFTMTPYYWKNRSPGRSAPGDGGGLFHRDRL